MNRRLSRILLAVATAGSALVASAGASWQDVTQIEAAALHVARSVTAPGYLMASPVATVDPNLRLGACDVPLQTTAGVYRLGAKRLTVQVDCAGRMRWRVWVPVTLQLRIPVVVAARPVARGAVLVEEDLATIQRDSDGTTQYVSDPSALVGRRARADIMAGQPVSAANSTADQVVTRGQQVTLLTGTSGIRVTSRGIAQSDGGLGTRIRVRCISSDRVVEGVVRSSEVVEVLLPGAGRG